MSPLVRARGMNSLKMMAIIFMLISGGRRKQNLAGKDNKSRDGPYTHDTMCTHAIPMV